MTRRGNPGTREEWLEAATREIGQQFADRGSPLPPGVRVTCGWPSGKALSGRIGEAWSPLASTTGSHETFISPICDDPVQVVSTLVHELCHHAAGIQAGHGPEFGKLARSFGLVGKLTATTAGPGVTAWVAEFVARVGPYPHGRLDPGKSGKKKQTTRMLKVTCPACGYTVRTTAQWLAVGLPTCPCGAEMVAALPSGTDPDE